MRFWFIPVTVCAMSIALDAGAQNLSAGTTWKNESGSELYIAKIDASTGAMSGSYTNRVASFGCRDEPFDATGWITGEKISFAVRWKNAKQDCASITSWTGFLENGVLVANWDLVFRSSALKHHVIMRGSNFFEPK